MVLHRHPLPPHSLNYLHATTTPSSSRSACLRFADAIAEDGYRCNPDFVLSVRELARARTDELETANDGPMAGLKGMRMVIDGDPAGVVPFRRFLSGAMTATGGQPIAAGDADPNDALDANVREFPELAIPVERQYVSTNEVRACLPCIEARNPELSLDLCNKGHVG